MEELKLELAELNEAKGMFGSDTFRKFVLEPLQVELDALKASYECKTLTELATVKGKKQGIQIVLDIVDGIQTKIDNKQMEIDNL